MYLFTNNNIEETKWDKENPGMYIENIKLKKETGYDAAETSKWNENNKNTYYIGSYEGCGCGWHSTKESDFDRNNEEDKEELFNKIKDRRALHKLLKSNNCNGSYIIVCQEGDQGKEINKTIKINIEKVKKAGFSFYELVKYILKG